MGAIDICFKLRQAVGSYALMAASNFGQTDFLQMCKFAEGDTAILMLKMARDRLRSFSKNGSGSVGEIHFCKHLQHAMQKEGLSVWDDEWDAVCGVANAFCYRIFSEF